MNSAAKALAPGVIRAIRCEARRAWWTLRRFGMDESDVFQDLVFHWLLRQSQYDVTRSAPQTFAAHVCRNRAAEMIKAAKAGKRGGGASMASLSDDTDLVNGRSIEREAGSVDVYRIRTGSQSRPSAELRDLAIDTDRVLQNLPHQLVALARLLAEGETPSEAGCRLGISKSTVYRRIARLREAFAEAGCGERSYGVAA